MVFLLANLKTKMSESSLLYLDSQITATKLSTGLQRLKVNESPWPDGITP